MSEKNLDERFQEAFLIASEMSQASLPQDVQLRLYAFYKQATFGTSKTNIAESYDLRNAFKINAWMQISHYTTQEAKEAYIELIDLITKQNKK